MKAKEMPECVIVDRQNCPVVNAMQMPLQGVYLVQHHWTEWALIRWPVFGVLHSVFRNGQNPGRNFRILNGFAFYCKPHLRLFISPNLK